MQTDFFSYSFFLFFLSVNNFIKDGELVKAFDKNIASSGIEEIISFGASKILSSIYASPEQGSKYR